MSIVIDGTGTISGVSSTGITTAQTVASAQLPAGTVLQVVNALSTTRVANTTSTYVDAGVTATITPKFSTSKILVMVTLQGLIKEVTNTTINLKLQRNGSDLSLYTNGIIGYTNSTAVQGGGGNAFNYYDSPATTSATTYKIQIASSNNTSSVSVNDALSSSASTITLFEVAA